MINDTIAAIATPPGLGGIGIVRLSGPDSEKILSSVFRAAGNRKMISHQMTYGHLYTPSGILDECMAVLMRAPRSYTREDVAEIQCHGGVLICQKALELCLKQGARMAEPGEFTRRAFENGRIDLSQAEAVMGLINAQSDTSRRFAVQQLQGGVSQFIKEAIQELISVEAAIAACTDYPDEVSEEEVTGDLLARIRRIHGKLQTACDERGAHLIRDGLLTVIYGRPNVGKSSLLNALLGEERAIVTAVPGTTRDQVNGSFYLDGALIHLVDTAGIRETNDPVERIGVERSRDAMAKADVILAVFDSSQPLTEEDDQCLKEADDRWVLILNKSDLDQSLSSADLQARAPELPLIQLSAALPDTLVPLKNLLRQKASVRDSTLLYQPRHLAAAGRAADELQNAIRTLQEGFPLDMAAVDLDAACRSLAEITGDQVDERILDEVFSQFCVGK